MKIRTIFTALAVVTAIALQGCVTHRILVDFSDPASPSRYIVEGDSLDLYDGRLALPIGSGWQFTDSQRDVDDTGEVQLLLTFTAEKGKPVVLPVAPPEVPGWLRTSRRNYLLFRKTKVSVTFPSWSVGERYGDLREFVPAEVEELNRPGADSLLSEERHGELRRLEAAGLQRGTVHRYMLHAGETISAWYSSRGLEVDSSALKGGLDSYSEELEAYLADLAGQDPADVPLEWYDDLRRSLIQAAAGSTGGPVEFFEQVADSLDNRWQCWLDLQDESVELSVLLKSAFIDAQADTVLGDTLFWRMEGSVFADSTVVIAAAGYDPILWADIAVVAALLILAGYLDSRKKKKRGGDIPTSGSNGEEPD